VLSDAARSCHGCDLYRHASQVVFGEGAQSSRIVFIGEQPGDEEDKQGKPFVGPAGRLLDRALEDAGIDRASTYVTNAVKHFKFEMRGKRRLHKKPGAGEIEACKPWLEAEIAVIRPALMVCLGATAARSLFGPAYRVTQERGRVVDHPWGCRATSTIHPSAILRAIDSEQRRLEYERFVADLKQMRTALAA
jgi:DNA polymerase